MKMNKARYMTLFMHIVSSGSITKAAEKLEVSKSVVSHQLKLLEQEIGVTLLKRTTRKQQLTSAGEQFYRDCIQLHQITESAWLHAKEEQVEPQGKLKVSAPHALMSSLIVPALAHAFRDYSKVNLDLVSNDDQQNLIENDIDLAIRIGLSKSSNLKQKRIGSFRDQLCQSLIRPVIDDSQFIEELPYIANTWQGKYIQHDLTSIKGKHKQQLAFKASHQANNLHTCISLIEQGLGIGLVPDFVCQKYRTSLRPILKDYQLAENPIYALHPYQGAVPIAVKMAILQIEKALTIL